MAPFLQTSQDFLFRLESQCQLCFMVGPSLGGVRHERHVEQEWKSFKYLKWQWRMHMCKCLYFYSSNIQVIHVIQSSSIIIPSYCNNLTSKVSSSGIHCTSSCSSSSCQNECIYLVAFSCVWCLQIWFQHNTSTSTDHIKFFAVIISLILIIARRYWSQVPQYQTTIPISEIMFLQRRTHLLLNRQSNSGCLLQNYFKWYQHQKKRLKERLNLEKMPLTFGSWWVETILRS